LDLFTWSRYAEISADRAGAHCAGDLTAVSRALFMLASGLSGNSIRFDLEDFLSQVDAMQVEDALPGQNAPKEDWFSTHPFSPLRVKALQLFHQSVLGGGAMNKADLEIEVQSVMSLMEPNYLDGRTETAESMRRLLFAGSLLVANADGNISAEEIAVFEKFFGKGAFKDELDLVALAADLDNRVQQVHELASSPQALQVVRDLCLVARAEGHGSDAGRALLDRIADGLEVTRGFICHNMDSTMELD
jgi:tellurite resistance protein